MGLLRGPFFLAPDMYRVPARTCTRVALGPYPVTICHMPSPRVRLRSFDKMLDSENAGNAGVSRNRFSRTRLVARFDSAMTLSALPKDSGKVPGKPFCPEPLSTHLYAKRPVASLHRPCLSLSHHLPQDWREARLRKAVRQLGIVPENVVGGHAASFG